MLCAFFTTFSFCVIFTVEVYTVLINCFLRGKSGWLWKEPVVEWCVKKWYNRQRHRRCSKWPPSAWTQASSLVHHWSMASSITLCCNSRHVSTSRCRNSTTSGITRSCITPELWKSTGFRSRLLAGHMSGLMNSGHPAGVSRNEFHQIIGLTWIVRKRIWLTWPKSDFLHFTSAITFLRWSG